MNAGLPSPAFRESYRWRATAVSVAPHRSVFNPDGRVHPSRARYEFYPTPPEATRALLSVEQFDGPVWEPACGQGHISKVPIDAGLEVVSTDLIQRDFGIGGRDFLSTTASPAKHIVTNPPYGRGLGDAFVHHALRLVRETGGTVAMLLNLASLAHPSRHELWTSHPPTAVYVLDELHCWPEGDASRAARFTGTHRYCWVVWRPGQAETKLGWRKTSSFTASG